MLNIGSNSFAVVACCIVLCVVQVRSGGIFYLDELNGEKVLGGTGRWVKSTHSEYTMGNDAIEIKPVRRPMEGYEGNNAMVLSGEHMKYGVSVRMPRVFEGERSDDEKSDETLVVQFEVLKEEIHHCGGAYVKLLRPGAELEDLRDDTPYSIMFGPDRCGDSDRVHFILQHQSPVTGEWEEKHATEPPRSRDQGITHLYTLVIRRDQTFSILIDLEVVRSGNLLTDMSPPISPSELIDDETDEKPADWADDDMMPNPDAVKPEHWDEDAPPTIPDETDEKPEGWLDNEPTEIPMPRPTEWDDEEDGEFEPVMVPNPACDPVGCGVWRPRQVANPGYYGLWKAPLVQNPEYKGVWKPRQIPNPHYFVDETPTHQIRFDALAVEVLTNEAGTVFDNFIIADNFESARKWAEETFVPKQEKERAFMAAIEASRELEALQVRMASDDPQERILGYVDYVLYLAQHNVGAAIVTAAIVLITTAILLVHLFTSAPVIDGVRKVEEEGEEDGEQQEQQEQQQQQEQEQEQEQQQEEPTPRRRSRRPRL